MTLPHFNPDSAVDQRGAAPPRPDSARLGCLFTSCSPCQHQHPLPHRPHNLLGTLVSGQNSFGYPYAPTSPKICTAPPYDSTALTMQRRFGAGTSVRDKTAAFKQAVSVAWAGASPSASSLSAIPPVRSARHALLEDDAQSLSRSNSATATPGKKKSEFAQRAQMIFLDVARTSEKLGNLAQRAYHLPLVP